MLHEKQARLEVASAGNLGALLSVRDFGDNAMARVHASKTIETMLDNVSERTGLGREVQQQQRLPGLQIVILPAIGMPGGDHHQVVVGPAQSPLIEGTTVPEAVTDIPPDVE